MLINLKQIPHFTTLIRFSKKLSPLLIRKLISYSCKRSNEGIVTFIKKDSDETIIPVRSFWFAWFAFHPETDIFVVEN